MYNFNTTEGKDLFLDEIWEYVFGNSNTLTVERNGHIRIFLEGFLENRYSELLKDGEKYFNCEKK